MSIITIKEVEVAFYMDRFIITTEPQYGANGVIIGTTGTVEAHGGHRNTLTGEVSRTDSRIQSWSFQDFCAEAVKLSGDPKIPQIIFGIFAKIVEGRELKEVADNIAAV